MDTVYSLTHELPDDSGALVFDFVVGRGGAGWHKHVFDEAGCYVALAPSDVEEVRHEVGTASPAAYVIEMRAAAIALEGAVGHLLERAEAAAITGELDVADRLAACAGDVERERLRTLDEVVAACDAAWDQAIERVEQARGDDPDALPGAIRTVELLWTARQAVRKMLGGGAL